MTITLIKVTKLMLNAIELNINAKFMDRLFCLLCIYSMCNLYITNNIHTRTTM